MSYKNEAKCQAWKIISVPFFSDPYKISEFITTSIKSQENFDNITEMYEERFFIMIADY